MATQPPAPLTAAIQAAARRYGVSPDTLTGIWRIESGSSYPNPYVNSSGYGGLFGTTKWNAPVQEQANYAASILANLLRTRGSLPAALNAYSGGGYSSVDGSAGTAPSKTGPAAATLTPLAIPAAPPTVDPALIALLLQNTPPAAATPLETPPKPPAAPTATPDFFTPLAQSQARTVQTGHFQLRPQPVLPAPLRGAA